MKISHQIGTTLALLCGMMTAIGQTNNPATDLPDTVAPGAQLILVTNGFGWSEGPSCDKDGNVFFTDQNNNRIMKWSATDGKVTEWMNPSGRANGMNFDAKGNLMACADE